MTQERQDTGEWLGEKRIREGDTQNLEPRRAKALPFRETEGPARTRGNLQVVPGMATLPTALCFRGLLPYAHTPGPTQPAWAWVTSGRHHSALSPSHAPSCPLPVSPHPRLPKAFLPKG